MSSTSTEPNRPIGLRPILAALACLVVIVVVMGLSPGRKHTALADSFQVLGHFGCFALAALIVALAAGRVHPFFARHRGLQYAIGLVTAIGAGGMLEFAQKFIPKRRPSWDDLLFDSLGAVAGIALLIALDHRRAALPWHRFLKGLAWTLLIGTVAFGAWPFASCARDYWYRHQAYPHLLEFSRAWSERFIWLDDVVDVRVGSLPDEWPDDAEREVAEVVIHPGEPFPGIGMKEPFPDWRGAERFAFDILNPAAAAQEVGLRIQDFRHDEDYYDRFNRLLRIEPGFQTVRISTSDIENGPRRRHLDLDHVDAVKVFLVRPTETVRLYIGNFRLE